MTSEPAPEEESESEGDDHSITTMHTGTGSNHSDETQGGATGGGAAGGGGDGNGGGYGRGQTRPPSESSAGSDETKHTNKTRRSGPVDAPDEPGLLSADRDALDKQMAGLQIVEEEETCVLEQWKLSVKEQPLRSWTLHALELAKIFESEDEEANEEDYANLYCPELYERFDEDPELQELNRVLIRRRFEQERDQIDGMIHHKVQMDAMLELNIPVTDMLTGMEEATRQDKREQVEHHLQTTFTECRNTLGDKHPQTVKALQDLIKMRRQDPARGVEIFLNRLFPEE